MKCKLAFLAAASLFFCVAKSQTPPPVGDPNEIWLDVSYSGIETGTITPGVDFTLDFYFANDSTLSVNTNGFRMWSPDGVTWTYRTDATWYGSDPLSRGVADKHVSVSGRWVNAYDGTISPILVPNPLLGGSAGTAADSIMIGGVAIFAPGLPSGALENLVQLNMTMGNTSGTWCVDSVAQFPPAGTWIFSTITRNTKTGETITPAFAGPFCWTVSERGLLCGDANDDGALNLTDATFLVNWIFKGGAYPPDLEAADANCNGQNNITDASYIVNYVIREGPPPCCP